MATEAILRVQSSAEEHRETPWSSLRELLVSVLRGCLHREMSRPFTSNRQTYRVCTACGARRRFDLNRWETYGPYFYA